MINEMGDLHIYYETRGEGNPVLAIHGFGIDHHVMDRLLGTDFHKSRGMETYLRGPAGHGSHTRPKLVERCRFRCWT